MSGSGLTIIIPSNRPLAGSRAAIDHAIRFCGERCHRLVISDNSGDPDKAAWLTGLGPDVTIVPEGPADAAGNLMAALACVKTPFFMPVGDDDLLVAGLSGDPPDYCSVPEDVAALRPDIRVIGAGGQVVRGGIQAFHQGEAAARIVAYAAGFGGDNASYYSAWRHDVLAPVLTLFCRHHPTGAGTGDWPMVLAGLAGGRMLADPSTRLDYALGRWAGAESIAASRLDLVRRAGLPPRAAQMMMLFHHADCHVYLNRSGSRLDADGKAEALAACAAIFLRPFARLVHQSPADWPEAAGLAGPFIEVLSRSRPDATILFKMVTAMLERLKPGLKDGYDRFLEQARAIQAG